MVYFKDYYIFLNRLNETIKRVKLDGNAANITNLGPPLYTSRALLVHEVSAITLNFIT